MRITKLVPWLGKTSGSGWEEYFFVEVRTDEGITGWGEITTTTLTANRAVAGVIRQLNDLLVGEDPARIEYLTEQQRQHGNVPPELRLLIEVIARAVKRIGHSVTKGALDDLLGAAGTDNVQGEAQKKLDVIANEVLVEANLWGGQLAAMVSEELERPFQIPSEYPRGKYLLLMDPLDGSSNIDVNVSIGTIFSVLSCPDGAEPDERAFLQPGRNQVAAGFAVYGPQTLLVLTVGRGAAAFTLDRDLGTFFLTRERIDVPADTAEFAINMSNMRNWEPPVKRYIEECLAGK